jgi:hypothetical protein
VASAIERMSPKEKAELRVQLRKHYNLPAKPEKDLREN